MDVGVRVGDVHVLGEVCVGELAVINYITIIVLDDQVELFVGGVVELHFEGDAVVNSALIFYSHLFIGGCLFGPTAICQGGQRVANYDYGGGYCYCDDLCYSFLTIVFLYFTKLLTKTFEAGVSLENMAENNRGDMAERPFC